MTHNTTTHFPVATGAAPRLRGQVLRKIYRIWLWRKLVPMLVIETAILTFVFIRLSTLVFMQRIIENATTVLFNSPSSIVSFAVSTFATASRLEQFLAVGFVILGVLFVRHLTQGVLRWILVRANYFGNAER